MRIALIGDIHLFQTQVHPTRLFGKRLMGHTNLMLNRRFRFNHRVLEPLIDRAAALKPDMVLLSGDVTTTSLEDEFHDVARYLEPLNREVPCVIVPGNHDKYTFRSARKQRMGSHMGGMLPKVFPHIHRLSPNWQLLGLDSAEPQLFWSRGALGHEQMQATEAFIRSLSRDDAVVVLCHYPAKTPAGVPHSWGHALAEAKPLHDMMTASPARFVFVHGHVHKPWQWDPANGSKVGNGDNSGLMYLNAGAPCLTSNKYPLGQGFWEVDLPDDPWGPLELIHHVPEASGDPSGDHKPDCSQASTATANQTHQKLDLRWVIDRVL